MLFYDYCWFIMQSNEHLSSLETKGVSWLTVKECQELRSNLCRHCKLSGSIVMDLLSYSVSFQQGKTAKCRSITAIALYQADEKLKIEIFKQALVHIVIKKLEHLSNSPVNVM